MFCFHHYPVKLLLSFCFKFSLLSVYSNDFSAFTSDLTEICAWISIQQAYYWTALASQRTTKIYMDQGEWITLAEMCYWLSLLLPLDSMDISGGFCFCFSVLSLPFSLVTHTFCMFAGGHHGRGTTSWDGIGHLPGSAITLLHLTRQDHLQDCQVSSRGMWQSPFYCWA